MSEMSYHSLPLWLDIENTQRAGRYSDQTYSPPVKATILTWRFVKEGTQQEYQQVQIHEVRHWSDGWVCYYSEIGGPWWSSRYFYKQWADRFFEGWIQRSGGNRWTTA